METKFKEGNSYLDKPNKRVIVRYKYEDEVIIRLVFNFKWDVPDELDGNFRVFMHMSAEEAEYLKERKTAAWKRLCQVNK